jgi:hypothetical protein
MIQRKEREVLPREAPFFPPFFGALLEVLKGHISKIEEADSQTS